MELESEAPPPPRLIDEVRRQIRAGIIRTVSSELTSTGRGSSFGFTAFVTPAIWARSKSRPFLNHLEMVGNVSASTQNQAKAALLFQQDKHQPKPDDSEAVANWRQRMASPEAKELCKQRAATAECVNAQARNRALLRMPVRGLTKVRSVVGRFVLAHKLLRMAALAPHLIGWGTNPSAVAPQAC